VKEGIQDLDSWYRWEIRFVAESKEDLVSKDRCGNFSAGTINTHSLDIAVMRRTRQLGAACMGIGQWTSMHGKQKEPAGGTSGEACMRDRWKPIRRACS
jgi:hypothetical protein